MEEKDEQVEDEGSDWEREEEENGKGNAEEGGEDDEALKDDWFEELVNDAEERRDELFPFSFSLTPELVFESVPNPFASLLYKRESCKDDSGTGKKHGDGDDVNDGDDDDISERDDNPEVGNGL